MIALLSSIVGFLAAGVPELFKAFQDRRDKAHELAMAQIQISMNRDTAIAKKEEAEAVADGSVAVAESQRLLDAQKPTGIRWVDAFNGIVRPTLTFGLFIEYSVIKYWQYTLLDPGSTPWLLWNTEDQAIFCTVLSFWFGQRCFKKIR